MLPQLLDTFTVPLDLLASDLKVPLSVQVVVKDFLRDEATVLFPSSGFHFSIGAGWWRPCRLTFVL
jgi:hypothetical protein